MLYGSVRLMKNLNTKLPDMIHGGHLHENISLVHARVVEKPCPLVDVHNKLGIVKPQLDK